MSYPPPPGLSSQTATSNAPTSYSAPGTTTHSLPPRPSGPPPTFRAFNTATSTATPSAAAFAFRPRQVAPSTHSTQPTTYSSGYAQPAYSAPPGSYGATSSPYASVGGHYGTPPPAGAPAGYGATQSISSAPHIVNPFPLPGQQQHAQTAHYGGVGAAGAGRGKQNNQQYDSRYPPLDPEMEAQIAQQQSIYIPADQQQVNSKDKKTTAGTGANTTSLGPLNPAFGGASTSGTISAGPTSADGTPISSTGAQSSTSKEKQPTVIRHGGGQTWSDSTLLEWDPAHFRLFVGNLAGEVTDESLLKAFSKYPSVQKARVIRDKRTTKSRGYGFVSFSDGDEYFRAAREMNGKYIGSHPVLLKRSNTEIRPVVVGGKKDKKGGASRGGAASDTTTNAGVKKKVKKNKVPERKVLG